MWLLLWCSSDLFLQIYSDGKEVVCQKLQSGQATLGNTRAAAWLGYGVDCTLSVTENLVDRFLPPCDEKNEEGDEEEQEGEEETTEEKEGAVDEVKRTKSRFGLRFRMKLRRRKSKKQKEDSTSITSSESEEEGKEVTICVIN